MNMVALILLCLIPQISLADPKVDIDVTSKLSPDDAKDKHLTLNMNLEDLRSKITKDVVEEVFKNLHEVLNKKRDLEIKLAERGRVISKETRKTDIHLMRGSDPIVRERESLQIPFDEASYQFCKRFNLSRDDINNILPNVSLDGISRKDDCMRMLTTTTAECNATSRYRTADGQCNNLRNPTWGSAMACQQRFLPAHYEGNSGFRESKKGGPLPLPRILSLNLHHHYNKPSVNVTQLHMFFGQFLDHDLTLTPIGTTVDNQVNECCPAENETHPQCAPIHISKDDPFYSLLNMSCLNFVRSASCATCRMGPKQVMNQVTSYIDGSQIYGNSENATNSLRSNNGTDETPSSLLRVQYSSYGALLPPSPNPQEDQCSVPGKICFEAGDPRVNQHSVLASLHTICVREHNRIAIQLRDINPHWDGEKTFQEARRIMGAQLQAIVYNEYLPITIGNDSMTNFNLWMGSITSYNESLNPTMWIEFTTAAFRFGHTQINSFFPDNTTLKDSFFQPFDLYNGSTGSHLSGVSSSCAQSFDKHLVPDVTEYLYRVRGDPIGLDLASFNIQRGRDHGLPTYVDMVKFCSSCKIEIRTFQDLARCGLMSTEQANKLKENYGCVEDVDLWTGCLAEIPIKGGIVGPTTACIISIQFHALKFGDRFYFEHANQPGSFTTEQVVQLRGSRLSHIICLNTEVKRLSLNVMLSSSKNNPLIDCSNVSGVNLSYWKSG